MQMKNIKLNGQGPSPYPFCKERQGQGVLLPKEQQQLFTRRENSIFELDKPKPKTLFTR